MNWFAFIAGLLPLVDQIIKSIQDAIAAGKTQSEIHAAVSDHLVELPAKIRSV